MPNRQKSAVAAPGPSPAPPLILSSQPPPLPPPDHREYLLRLYVAGANPQSTRAIVDARKLCEDHLGDRCRLEVIDIYQRPALARDEQIVAVPTLVRHLPKPLRRLVGDLSSTERILKGLDLSVH
jgi:circadian clock protein KaiB